MGGPFVLRGTQVMQVKGAQGAPDVIAGTAAGLLLVVAMILGGASRGGTADLVVHLAAIPALMLGLARWRQVHGTALQRAFAWWLLAGVVVVAAQLLPLPSGLFERLAGRDQVVSDLRDAGVASSWRPMTLDRWGSLRALLAFATFAAMWLLASTLDRRVRERLFLLALVVALPMALLGFAQAGAGHAPALHFHGVDAGATATFANRTHLASLLAMLIPFAILAAHRAQQGKQWAWALLGYAVAVLFLLAAALTFSRAGVVLAGLSTAAALLIMVSLTGDGAGVRTRLPVAAVVLLAGAAVATYAWNGLVDRFDQDPLTDLRWQYLGHGVDAAGAWLPWGSGFGSFREIYAAFEPVAAMVETHALHAHNELLEVAVEAGLPGLLLVAAFVALLVAGIGTNRSDHAHGVAWNAAPPVAAVVPLLHSLGDYPLRTFAVAVLFSLVIAHLMAGDPLRND